jgi:Na+/melibiose symporter-like transporter
MLKIVFAFISMLLLTSCVDRSKVITYSLTVGVFMLVSSIVILCFVWVNNRMEKRKEERLWPKDFKTNYEANNNPFESATSQYRNLAN